MNNKAILCLLVSWVLLPGCSKPPRILSPIYKLPTATHTRTDVWTLTPTTTATRTPTPTPTATSTWTPSPTPTLTFTGTYFTPTFTVTNTPSWSNTPTHTRTASLTPTATSTPTNTGTSTWTPTPMNTPDPALAFSCITDLTDGFPASGVVTFGFPTVDFVPLCNGWILVQNQSVNQILLYNVVTRYIARTYQLSSTPNGMKYDPSTNLLFVGLENATSLAKIDLASGAVNLITLSAPISLLCVGPPNLVFCKNSNAATLQVVDTVANAVVTTYGNFNIGTMVYDGARDRLIAGRSGWLLAYDFNPITKAFSAAQTNTSHYVDEVVLSPDGNHLASAGDYIHVDYNPADILSSYGDWSGEYYGGFSPDSQTFACTKNYNTLRVYSVTNHSLLWSRPLVAYTNSQHRVNFSRGGRILYNFSPFDPQSKIEWVLTP